MRAQRVRAARVMRGRLLRITSLIDTIYHYIYIEKQGGTHMIDQTALRSLSYGLYIVSAQDGDRCAGCVVNTFQQVTSSPLQVSVALNKENVTTDVILDSGRFTVSCLSQEATMELIGTFGFHCSADTDKFSACKTDTDAAGVPYVAEQCVARFSVRVVQAVNLGTHMLYIGEVEEAEKLCTSDPMTYAYYHLVKGGKTPPKASSYLPDAPDDSSVAASGQSKPKVGWRCKVCGHIEYVDELPDDFVCPVCGVGKEMFERVEL